MIDVAIDGRVARTYIETYHRDIVESY